MITPDALRRWASRYGYADHIQNGVFLAEDGTQTPLAEIRDRMDLRRVVAGMLPQSRPGLLGLNDQSDFVAALMRHDVRYNNRMWKGAYQTILENESPRGCAPQRFGSIPVPADTIECVGDKNHPAIQAIIDHSLEGDIFYFPVHPERDDAEYAHPMKGRLTSGDRTFLIQHTCPFMLKVAHPQKPFRGNMVKHSVHVSRTLERLALSKAAPPSFAFFREPAAIYARGIDEGIVVRDLDLFPPAAERSYVITYASLWSQDQNTKSGPTVLEYILASVPKTQHRTLVEERIVKPVLDNWMFLAEGHGLLHAQHGQNALLQLDMTGLPTGVAPMRDMRDIFADPARGPDGVLGIPCHPDGGHSLAFRLGVYVMDTFLFTLEDEYHRITGDTLDVDAMADATRERWQQNENR